MEVVDSSRRLKHLSERRKATRDAQVAVPRCWAGIVDPPPHGLKAEPTATRIVLKEPEVRLSDSLTLQNQKL